MPPVRIRLKTGFRLRRIHGARLALPEPGAPGGYGVILAERSGSQSTPGSYFNLLADDDGDDCNDNDDLFCWDVCNDKDDDLFSCSSRFQTKPILLSPAPLISGGEPLPDDEIVDTLAGPSFRDYLGFDGVRFVSLSEEYEAGQIQKHARGGEPAGTPVPSVQDFEETCPSDDDRSTIALEHKLRQLDIGEEISEEELLGFMAQLPPTYYIDSTLKLDLHQRIVLYERHALYRIRACKLLQGKDACQQDYAKLKRRYTPEYLAEKGYFMRYDEDGTFCWFFHPDHCHLACLDDYQRLVLLNDGGYEYNDWDDYVLSYHTHETDCEYVKYCETFSSQVKWIEECLDLYSTCPEKWWKLRDRAFRQAMKIATSFTKISVHLVRLAFGEYASSISYDFNNLKDLDGVYFEIWKRVTKQEKSFQLALKEVYQLNKFPQRQGRLKYALEIDRYFCESEFHCLTAGITKEVGEDKAFELIAMRIKRMCKKPKMYEQYARKKIKIAELLGLISTA
ncbi:unnamed protein product [Urochloa humidicola]